MNHGGPSRNNYFPHLGMGLGLRSDHFQDVLAGQIQAQWFEVITENYLSDGGRPFYFIEKIRRDYPMALHGVSLNIGSASPLNTDYVKRMANLIKRLAPAIVSDHCCWTGVDGINSHDLLPLPFTQESLQHVVSRVLQVQDLLGRRILLENLSSYISFSHSEMTESEFLAQIAQQADCGILLDVNNVYVSSVNHGFDPREYIKSIPADRVGQIHLAGHSQQKLSSGKIILIDTHDHPVCDEVWDLYRFTINLLGPTTTMVEWDAQLPAFSRLEEELLKARRIEETLYESSVPATNFPRNFTAPIAHLHHHRAVQRRKAPHLLRSLDDSPAGEPS